MRAKKSLTDKDGEVGELTAAEIKKMKPLQEADPEMAEAMVRIRTQRLRGRPKKPFPKKSLTVRLDADVVSWLKKSGAGYQTRLNEFLRDMMKDAH
jgi:uncharacterized protein (DUF4415 family)